MDYTRKDGHFQKAETLKRGDRWAWRVTPWKTKPIDSGPDWMNESDAAHALNFYLNVRRSKRKW